MTERRYSYPVWRMRFGQAMLLLIAGLGFVAMFAGTGAWWGYLIFSAALSTIVWWALWRAPRRRATETREGIHTWDLAFPVNRLLRWEDISHFKRVSSPFGQLVEAVNPRGGSTPIMGLDAAAKTSWDGEEPGEVDDIVAELNRRLLLWREELGLPTPVRKGTGRSPAT